MTGNCGVRGRWPSVWDRQREACFQQRGHPIRRPVWGLWQVTGDEARGPWSGIRGQKETCGGGMKGTDQVVSKPTFISRLCAAVAQPLPPLAHSLWLAPHGWVYHLRRGSSGPASALWSRARLPPQPTQSAAGRLRITLSHKLWGCCVSQIPGTSSQLPPKPPSQC